MNRYRVQQGSIVDLATHDAADLSEFSGGKQAGKARMKELNKELEALQELMYAEGKHKVLIILQGMDTAGKDGTIRHVFEGVNPQGVKVTSFGVPSELELAHDYLWRVHRHAPKKGEIMIFNRSQYEDVLVVRVHELVPLEQVELRYRHMVEFERMLADEGTLILKFFLHISKEEQRTRLQERLERPEKQWKFNPGDIKERKRWQDYLAAYETVLSRTSMEFAPWYIVPADRKWYRNLVIASVLVDALKGLDMRFPPVEEGIESVVID